MTHSPPARHRDIKVLDETLHLGKVVLGVVQGELGEDAGGAGLGQQAGNGGVPRGVELEAAVQGGHGVGGAVRLGLDKLLEFQLSLRYFWAKLIQPC